MELFNKYININVDIFQKFEKEHMNMIDGGIYNLNLRKLEMQSV